MEILPQITQILAETPSIAIDTIRADFRKDRRSKDGSKLDRLNLIARAYGKSWRKMDKSDWRFKTIAKKYRYDTELNLTNIFELDDLNIFYANTAQDSRHRARLEIFGLKQYCHEQTPPNLISELLKAVGNVSSVDLCFDSSSPFDVQKLAEYFHLRRYENAFYANHTGLSSLSKFYIYDKKIKDGLKASLWRLEATAPIIDLNKPALLPRAERLELQLRQAVRDFSQIIDIATKAQPAKLAYKAHNNKRELRA